MSSLSVWEFFLVTLALWRVCRLLVYEDGPFFIIQRIRLRLGVIEEDDGITATNVIGLLITCPLCLSFWLAPLFIVILGGSWLEWLALSGSVSLVFLLTDLWEH